MSFDKTERALIKILIFIIGFGIGVAWGRIIMEFIFSL